MGLVYIHLTGLECELIQIDLHETLKLLESLLGHFCTFVQLFMPYLNFEYTKVATYTMENVGGWY